MAQAEQYYLPIHAGMQHASSYLLIIKHFLQTFLAKISSPARAPYTHTLDTTCTSCFIFVGPSVVRALPLAAGRNEGGHYFHYKNYKLPVLFLPPLFKTTDGVIVLFQICAWAPNKYK